MHNTNFTLYVLCVNKCLYMSMMIIVGFCFIFKHYIIIMTQNAPFIKTDKVIYLSCR